MCFCPLGGGVALGCVFVCLDVRYISLARPFFKSGSGSAHVRVILHVSSRVFGLGEA